MKTITKYSSLLGVFFVYSLAVLSGKFASTFETLSIEFFFFYGLQIGVLMIYAVLWQFALKKNKLSVAYMLKASTMYFGILFGYLFFKETITLIQVIALVVIFSGIVLVINND